LQDLKTPLYGRVDAIGRVNQPKRPNAKLKLWAWAPKNFEITGVFMRFKRSQRIQELIHEEISKLIQRGLKDPRIGFTTITKVELTDNLKLAKVFVSVMGSEQEKIDTLEGLNSAKGFVRNTMSKNLYLKYIPELEFRRDDNADHVEKISRIINELHSESGGQPL
jgi:ribosome-binding factor A